MIIRFKRYEFYSAGITIDDNNNLNRWYCSPSSITSCQYNDFSLNGVKRTSRQYFFGEELVNVGLDLSSLDNPFDNAQYEYLITKESGGYWQNEPDQSDEPYVLSCFDTLLLELEATNEENTQEKSVSLRSRRDARDQTNESCYPIRGWGRELLQFDTRNLFNIEDSQAAFYQPAYSRGIPAFFDNNANEVLGFSIHDYYNNPESYDAQEIVNDLANLDYSASNYEFFVRRGLSAFYTFTVSDSEKRMQYSIDSNNLWYRWEDRFTYTELPLEGGSGSVKEEILGSAGRERFYDLLEEYGLDELLGPQGRSSYSEISTLNVSTQNNGELPRASSTYYNFTRQQRNLGAKYVGDATQLNFLTKFNKDWILSVIRDENQDEAKSTEILVNNENIYNERVDTTDRPMNLEIVLTQDKTGNPGVRDADEDRISVFMSVDISTDPEASDPGLFFTARDSSATVRLEWGGEAAVEKTIANISRAMRIHSDNEDVLKPYLNVLKEFYAQLNSEEKQRVDEFFNVKSYASIFLNNNAINSGSPLWISYDLLEGPVEYYDDSSSDFENLVFFDSAGLLDSFRIGDDDTGGRFCVGIANKTAANVTVDLVVKGPETFNFDQPLDQNNNALILSDSSLSWGSNSNPQCVTFKESPNYDFQGDKFKDAWFTIELVPRTSATTYRGYELLVQVRDKYQ